MKSTFIVALSLLIGAFTVVIFTSNTAVSKDIPDPDNQPTVDSKAIQSETPEAGSSSAHVANKAPRPGSRQYEELHKKIAVGKASLAEVRMALSEPEPLILTNIMQALYSMRWHRGVLRMLDGLWTDEREKYPELAWEQINNPPARIALASTINRIKIVKTEPYLDYIRQHINSNDKLVGAQAAVGLGFNGDPRDLETLKNLGAGTNPYIAQSAITGLGLFGSNQARDALIDLLTSFKDTNRGRLIKDVLKHAYKWPPPPQYNPLPPENAG